MSELFSEFDSVSAKQWKQKIQYDLKGGDFNELLVWKSPEGIHVKPAYHGDDFKKPFESIPGQPPQWKIAQHVFIDDTKIANRLALDAVARGSEAIYFTAEKSFKHNEVFSSWDFDKITIYFDLKFIDASFLQELIHFLSQKKAKVFYNIDLIANLASTGNWFYNLKKDHEILESILEKFPSEHILGINTSLYQNAGADIAQQLAYGLAQANEYLNHFATSEGSQKNLKLTFKLSIGGNYFFEIAKIRALRKLYAALAEQYGLKTECHILAIPSKRNKTLYDYNVNLLRTSTECMSAILGGADTICNLPYDALYHKSNEFGERISRNQLLILKSESYFDKVANPADGAYYIESLTDQLADKALTIFNDIEQAGGFLKSLKEGVIQKKIKENAKKEQQQFDEGELTLLGTNKYVHKDDKMKDELELYPFVKIKPRKTLIAPIVENRLAEKIEQERLEHED